MTPELQAEVGAYLIACYPSEGCGFLVVEAGVQSFIPCPNIADDPRLEFRIEAALHASIEDHWEIVALVHSHPDAWAKPSDADRMGCEASGVPWIIASVLKHAGDEVPHVAAWLQFEPASYLAPLQGREYAFGVLDCYTLVQDWYKRERGVTLTNFERHDKWWDDGVSDLFREHFAEEGFSVVPPGTALEEGDIVLMEIRSRNGTPNHAGIYLMGGKLLHHPYRRLSRLDVYGGMWAQYTRLVIRRNENP